MQYRELAPPPALATDVACLWYDERALDGDRTQLVLPDGCVDIVWIRGQEPIVAGPATQPVDAPIAEGATVVGVRFAPGRAPAYVGLPADELLNQDVPLADLWGDAAVRVADRLEATSSTPQALDVLSDAVQQRRRDVSDPLVGAAVGALGRRPALKVMHLADMLGVSERQLLRRFTSAVGYGPRTLGRVVRFRRFLSLLRHRHRSEWDLARLAAEAGFADHPHLVHECSELAGLTPTELRARWS